MTILKKIIARKKEDLQQRKAQKFTYELTLLPYYHSETKSLRDNRLNTTREVGIIAEMKKASPSKGVLLASYDPKVLFKSYQTANVEGISILTDQPFFQGSLYDLLEVRSLTVDIPLLCKDFIIDSYQIAEAKGYGASVILLIASILEESQYQEFYYQAKEIGLEVLTEIHNYNDLEKVLKAFVPEMIGVNNRDLATFKTSLSTTVQLAKEIPDETILISESGIHSPEQIKQLNKMGVKGVLVGEQLVTSQDKLKAIDDLVGSK